MAASNDLPLVTILLLLTACLLAFLVLGQIATTYVTAYKAASTEIQTFVDAVDFSIQENEACDRDVEKITRLEDKMRLLRLLREIQKCGDDLREDLNRVLVDEGGTRLRQSATYLWAAKRKRLEERLSRLDMLRMRFLVVYMGVVAAKTAETPPPVKDPEKNYHLPKIQPRPGLPHALTEGIARAPPLRRLTTQAMGHNDHSNAPQKMGWAGVVAELQRSPLMHKRHASIETSMANSA